MKTKTHFTRKNLIFLALLFFFLVIQTFCLFCLDEAAGIIKKGNPIAELGGIFGIEPYKLNVIDYVNFLLVMFWTFIGTAAIMYQVRLAKFYDEPVFSVKKLLNYGLTIVISLVLSFGLAIFLQWPYSFAKFFRQIVIIFQTWLLGALIYIVVGALIFGVFVLIINFRHIDEPFRFFGKEDAAVQEEIENRNVDEALDEIEDSDLSKSLDIPVDEDGNPISINGLGGGGGGGNGTFTDSPLGKKEQVFPALCAIDSKFEFGAETVETDDVTLQEFCELFRNYLATNELYFDIRTIREFVSAFATTRLVILEGLSGTGKSSLPRYLANFLSTEAFFAPVQSTWRDRTNIIGYFNDFSKTFNETDFLKRLYQANYENNKINIMVLDEMNLSRIEYYFADFLSILEYPSSQWKLHLMQLPFNFEPPHHIVEGKIRIPENTFFVGTANKDDSTYTITDKVYDRAITLDFDDMNDPFEIEEEQGPISMSYEGLAELFAEAKAKEENWLTKEDLAKFKIIADFTYQTFDLTFGNRIYNQIQQFVPVFIACGGSKEEALDFLFTRKVLYKIEGRFEEYVKAGLIELKSLINKTYGENFSKSIAEINRMLKRL